MADFNEFFWAIKVIQTGYVQGRIFPKKIGGTISQFEKAIKVSSPNPQFRQWFREMKSRGAIEPFRESKTRGGTWMTYVVVKKRMREFIINHHLYKPIYGFFKEEFVLN